MSERRSPPTDRVVQVVQLLANQPQTPFTLAYIARQLGLNKATCLGILHTLCEAGWLVRQQPDKRYSLGPGLLALGRAAQASFATLEVARPILQHLSFTLGLATTASTLIEDHIVLLSRSGPQTERDAVFQSGLRFPYAPPFGVAWAVWKTDVGLAEWLDSRPELRLDTPRADKFAQSARALGYVVERRSDLTQYSYSLMGQLDKGSMPPEVQRFIGQAIMEMVDQYYVIDELVRGKHDVSLIMAPTFDSHGNVDLMITIYPMADGLDSQEIDRLGQSVLTTANVITAAVEGNGPWSRKRRLGHSDR